jgi:beta-N-acetylhexosaminidase
VVNIALSAHPTPPLASCPAHAQSRAMERSIDQLSIEQLCGQLIVAGYMGEEPTASVLKELSCGRRAGVILFKRNVPTLRAAYEACRAIAATAPDDLPAWVSVDQEGGRVSRLPSPFLQLPAMMNLGGLCDEDLISQAAEEVGLQLSAVGFNLNFAPVLDVHTRPENPVIGDRAFATTAGEVSRSALAYLRGLKRAKMLGCGKHFPGHGDTTVDSHLALPHLRTGLQRLRELELIPFRAAIDAGIECLMSAHIVMEAIDPSLPATLSEPIVTRLLRVEMEFGGVLFSDDLEMNAIAHRWSAAQAAVRAVAAGCDVLLICKSEELQAEAHAALVQQATRDGEFRCRCQQAAARSLGLRRLHRALPATTWDAAEQRMAAPSAQAVRERIAQRVDRPELKQGHSPT